ncbi:MAG: nuclear transport factor 2 family protein [Cyclobacteriaceae bacterium]
MKHILIVLFISILANFNLLAGDSTLIDLSGRWFWEGRGINTNNNGNGRIVIELEQKGDKLVGNLVQLNGPSASAEVSDMPLMNKPLFSKSSHLAATIEGEILGPASGNDNQLVILKRFQKDKSHMAIFTGNHSIGPEGEFIDGYFVNTWGLGNRGWFVMHKMVDEDESVYDKDRKEIQNMVETFEKSIKEKDSESFLNLYISDNAPVSNPKKTKSAKLFMESLAKYENPEETFHSTFVNINKKLAILKGRYHWAENGEKKGEGDVIWLLKKTKEGWKIIHHAWEGMNKKMGNQLNSDREEIIAMCKLYAKCVEEKNTEEFKSLYYSDDTPITNPGKTIEAVEFIKWLQTYEQPGETLHNIVINENGNLATMNARFHWFENGERKGQGQQIWLLKKIDGKWKIIHQLWQGLKEA